MPRDVDHRDDVRVSPDGRVLRLGSAREAVALDLASGAWSPAGPGPWVVTRQALEATSVPWEPEPVGNRRRARSR